MDGEDNADGEDVDKDDEYGVEDLASFLQNCFDVVMD